MNTTATVGIAGSPIGHSLTPLLQQAAFQALGLRWRSERFEIGVGGGAALVEQMRSQGIRGLSITMPLKAEVARHVDRVEGDAALLESVNCLSLEEGVVVGLSTDGPGLVAAIDRALHLNMAGQHIAVIGAGGAARAVAAAVAGAGAASVGIIARSDEAALRCAALAGNRGHVVDLAGALEATILINATPVGMADTASSDAPPLVNALLLGPHHVAVDLIYHPLTTRWLEQAASKGATTLGGLGMLVHQAATQIERWTGEDAPVDVMWDAAMAEVGSR